MCGVLLFSWDLFMMKIYFSKYYDDYIFVIGGQAYLVERYPWYFGSPKFYTLAVLINPNHIKNSRMHKRKEDKEVEFIMTVRDE